MLKPTSELTPNYLAPQSHGVGGKATYEQLLSQNLELAMSEGSIFFEDRGAVQTTLRRICSRLDELEIPYAVADGMALFIHGFRRFTEDVDILVTQSGLTKLHEQLEGRGFVRPFEKSKNLRDTETKVKVEFLISGQFPGDGKPKPVAFPDPAMSAERRLGISVINLKTLVELKLASGMTGQHRAKDLVDVGELISTLNLAREFGAELDPSVQDKYYELWDLHGSPPRYVMAFQHRADDPASQAQLNEMLSNKVQIETAPDRTLMNDYLLLYTSDEATAKKYGMKPEKEFFGSEE